MYRFTQMFVSWRATHAHWSTTDLPRLLLFSLGLEFCPLLKLLTNCCSISIIEALVVVEHSPDHLVKHILPLYNAYRLSSRDANNASTWSMQPRLRRLHGRPRSHRTGALQLNNVPRSCFDLPQLWQVFTCKSMCNILEYSHCFGPLSYDQRGYRAFVSLRVCLHALGRFCDAQVLGNRHHRRLCRQRRCELVSNSCVSQQ